MGRVRGKGKTQNVSAREDMISGQEEKLLTFRKRGRPQKIVNDYSDGDMGNKVEENAPGLKDGKEIKNELDNENGKKRNRCNRANEDIDSVKDENDVGVKLSATDVAKPVGFRKNGSRRKNMPRRAAEVGVECK
ncbi:hypothetical protein SAY86_005013 [Trapa natans]|uniref:Uncharacterized protein n=1 Tax=Trapa natans TaxID=22666 RepID=A0AAN7L0B4_TRANT|nr:hypothetical protein SAY86_005013 [Trapa natans]